MLVNCEPWSKWVSTLFFGFLRHTAMSRACKTTSRRLTALHCPADDTTGVEIDHDRQIGEALQRSDVGDVRHPDGVWRIHVELPIQRVVDDQ